MFGWDTTAFFMWRLRYATVRIPITHILPYRVVKCKIERNELVITLKLRPQRHPYTNTCQRR
jgi:hypothetical protein